MTDPVARHARACRVCNGPLDSVLDFGTPYISDFLLPGEKGVRAPLHVVRCEKCGLIQMEHTIDPDLLWGNRYWYKSGTNESMRAALRDIAVIAGGLEPGDKVLDIGANDGTLLSFYPDYVYKVAVDPITSFKEELNTHADVVVRDFWPTEIGSGFKRITSIACFYDVDDPHAFVEGIREALAPDGLWIVQMQDEDSILRDTAFDYFCHEHVTLYSTSTFARLLSMHGLRIVSQFANQVNGGSLRFVVGHAQRHAGPWRESTASNGARWLSFVRRVSVLGADTWHAFNAAAENGDYVVGLAASTKANTLLQWFRLGAEQMPVIVERAPEKIGRVTVGSNIPIVNEDDPHGVADIYVPLAWHFLDGLRQRHPDTPFLTLLPTVRTYPALHAEATLVGHR